MAVVVGPFSDEQVRALAFQFLAEQTAIHGETLPWAVLSTRFELDGRRVPREQQGIRYPGRRRQQ